MKLKKMRRWIIAFGAITALQIWDILLCTGWWQVLSVVFAIGDLAMLAMWISLYRMESRRTVSHEKFDPWLRRMKAYADMVQRQADDPLQTIDRDAVILELENYKRELDEMFAEGGSNGRADG